MTLVARGLGKGDSGTLVAFGLGISVLVVSNTNFDCAVQMVETFSIEQFIDVCESITALA